MPARRGFRAARRTAAGVLRLTVLVDDRFRAVRLLTEIGEIGVNVEDLRLDHSSGQNVGMVELSVLPNKHDHLIEALNDRGWRVPSNDRNFDTCPRFALDGRWWLPSTGRPAPASPASARKWPAGYGFAFTWTRGCDVPRPHVALRHQRHRPRGRCGGGAGFDLVLELEHQPQ